ncbi:hypothetical protein [Flavobacterium commune]|uniref:Uncharacterized protein n=1 Tax=Flavobacterium commune TaxID=1306519 RepID=A0A1D9PAP9_9FLAO|nr:hypothetical protein [Flavobacterium commune]AOZ99602.1 hypothetical protein BIW12_09195 [Flavobacterium commune]
MFQKPTTKSFAAVAIETGAFVAGAKVGDGIVAVMPDSVSSYRRYLVAGMTLLAAACVAPKTTMAQAAQNALIGAGAKQLYDELSETLAGAIPVTAGSSTTNKFVNAVVGHSPDAALVADTSQVGVGAWLGEPENMWDRPAELQEAEFTGL